MQKTFSSGAVPLGVAAYILDDEVQCPNCKAKCKVTAQKNVRMALVLKSDSEEDSDENPQT